MQVWFPAPPGPLSTSGYSPGCLPGPQNCVLVLAHQIAILASTGGGYSTPKHQFLPSPSPPPKKIHKMQEFQAPKTGTLLHKILFVGRRGRPNMLIFPERLNSGTPPHASPRENGAPCLQRWAFHVAGSWDLWGGLIK